MELLVALFFGLVQGLTEFLPISTGGHLALIQNVNQTIFGEELFSPTLTFDILLRFGTLMAIVFVFYSDIRGLWNALTACIKDIRNKEFSLRTEDPDRKLLYMLAVTALFLIPALFLTEYTGVYLNGLTVIALMLLVSGISNLFIDRIGVKENTNAFFEQNFGTEGLVPDVAVSKAESEQTDAEKTEESEADYIETAEAHAEVSVMVSVAEALEEEICDSDNVEELTEGLEEDEPADESEPRFFLKQAATVGLFQLCSSIPGISRCSLTVLGGLVAGFRRDFTVKYAFLSAIPVLVVKILIQTVTVLIDGIRMNWLPYLLGMIAAFISGVFAIGWMRKSVRKYSCRRFGVYCLILGIIIFVIQLRG
ncbi:MAG: hypothetical protein J6A61_00290 [Clostridia bacterium]|nr:hypothetical protein [Clostridia bacterium]